MIVHLILVFVLICMAVLSIAQFYDAMRNEKEVESADEDTQLDRDTKVSRDLWFWGAASVYSITYAGVVLMFLAKQITQHINS